LMITTKTITHKDSPRLTKTHKDSPRLTKTPVSLSAIKDVLTDGLGCWVG
jgi:hypothetical protein